MTTPADPAQQDQRQGQRQGLDYTRTGDLIQELEAIAAVAKAEAARLRANVQTGMEALYRDNVAAPTQRVAAGTFTLPVTKAGIVLARETDLLAWVEQHHPGEVEVIRRVREGFIARLVKDGAATPEGLMDPTTGEMIPGFEWQVGGRPKTVQFSKDKERRAAAEQAVADRLAGLLLSGELTAAIDRRAITARVEDATRAADPGVITVERARQVGEDIAAETAREEARRPQGPFVSSRVLTLIHTLLSRLDPPVTTRETKLAYISGLIGRELDTTRAMTEREATHVAAVLKDLVNGPPQEPWEASAHPDDDPWSPPATEPATPATPAAWSDADPADDPWG